MEAEFHSISYGRSDIVFELKHKKRKTLAIHVYPDKRVVVDAPANASLADVKRKVVKRAGWIKKQQRYFERFPPALPAHKYIAGEAFRYLGRQYTLKTKKAPVSCVKLLRGEFCVYDPVLNNKRIKVLLDRWYQDKSKQIFEDRFEFCLSAAKAKIGVEHSGKFALRKMKTRWGSCSRKGLITLNPELIGAHKDCTDYVIMHELCHLVEYNHSKEFYNLLYKVMPDWVERKDKLELTMEHRSL